MNRNLTCLSLAFGLLLASGSMAHAENVTVQNCAQNIPIDVQVFDGKDTAMAVPASSANRLGYGQKAQLQCSGDSCKYRIVYYPPPKASTGVMSQYDTMFGAKGAPTIAGYIQFYGAYSVNAFHYDAGSGQAKLDSSSC